jgi:hypothetical protein
MAAIEYLIHFLVYEFILLCCLLVAVIPLELLSELLENELLGNLATAVTSVLLLAWLFGGSWIAHNASRRRALEGEPFFGAFRNALDEAQLNLSFVPGLGRLFRRGPAKRSPFDAPDEP